MERIRVAADGWHFEGAETGTRFLPFGANFVFDYVDEDGSLQRSLTLLTDEVWRPAVLDKALRRAAELGMNVMKIFLPLPQVLPDPPAGEAPCIAAMDPPLFDRLDALFDTAERHGVYISLSLAEWGVHSLSWFHEGGAFFGAPEGGAADSHRILAELWRRIAGHCRDKTALFSYNLAVESYIPSDNLGGAKGPGGVVFDDRFGLPAFQRWLRARYAGIEELNAAHGTAYASFSQVTVPDALWYNPYTTAYNVPRGFLIDYNDFKECVTYLYYKKQADAIRRADPSHMVTAGLHPDQIGIAPQGYGWKTAGLNNREFDFLDYVTVHLYTNLPYLIHRPRLPATFAEIVAPGQVSKEEIARRRRECLLTCRFIGGGRPLMVEEFGHMAGDKEESFRETALLYDELAGHVSGFMLWQFGSSEGDAKDNAGPLNRELEINEWGRRWQALGLRPMREKPDRPPARTIVRIERDEACAPVEETAGELVMEHWEAYRHPVDFDLDGNAMIERIRREAVGTIWEFAPAAAE